jgi:phosphonatase-like hydrolase
VYDRGEVAAAFTAALRGCSIPFDPAEIPSWRGASKREVLRRLVDRQHPSLSAADREAMAADAYQRFRDALWTALHAAPGVAMEDSAPAFQRLRAAGIRVGLNSGFDRSIVDAVLAITAWPNRLFAAIVCGDDVEAGRPSPQMIFRTMMAAGVRDPRKVAVVGDTRLDLEAGANAGVAFRIGVLTGAHDRAALESAPHTHIVASVGAVPDIWLAGGGVA